MAESAIILAILRYLHILPAVLWMGSAAMMLMIVIPTVRGAPQETGPFMRRLAIEARFRTFVGVNAGATVLLGLITYGYMGGQDDYAPGDSWGGMLFHVGIAAGVLAFVLSLILQVPTQKRMQRLVLGMKGPPTPEQASALGELQAKMVAHGWIGFALMVVALLGMVMGSDLRAYPM